MLSILRVLLAALLVVTAASTPTGANATTEAAEVSTEAAEVTTAAAKVTTAAAKVTTEAAAEVTTAAAAEVTTEGAAEVTTGAAETEAAGVTTEAATEASGVTTEAAKASALANGRKQSAAGRTKKGILPFQLGLDFPGSGRFGFEFGTVVTGLQSLVEKCKNGCDLDSFDIPRPVQIAIKTKVRAMDKNGQKVDNVMSLVYILENVTMSLKVKADDAKAKLEEALAAQKAALEDKLASFDACAFVESLKFSVSDVEFNVGSIRGGDITCTETCAQNPFDALASRELPSKVVDRVDDAMAAAMDELMAWLTNGGLVAALEEYYRFKINCKRVAYPSDEVPALDDGFLSLGVLIILYMVLVILAAVFCCACCMGCCKWKDGPASKEEDEFLDECHSLIGTPTVPMFLRVMFYVAVVVNVLFFLSANISVGAVIGIDLTIAGKAVALPSIYDFSMLLSTIEMLKAGVYLLGIILLSFSVVWPYMKLLIVTLVWSFPSSLMRPGRRSCLLMWMDVLGKWSMFDVFALCTSMVIFNIAIDTPKTENHPTGYWGFVLGMTPVWGMFANLIAQIISQSISIFAIWTNRRAFKSDWHKCHDASDAKSVSVEVSKAKDKKDTAEDDQEGQEGQEMKPLKSGSSAPAAATPATIPPFEDIRMLERTWHTEDGPYQTSLLGKIVVTGMLVLTIFFVFVGFFAPGVGVRVVGIMGAIQEKAENGSSSRTFSPYSVSVKMSEMIPEDDVGLTVGTYALIVMVWVCVLFVPIAQAINLCFLWLANLPLKTMKTLLLTNEMLASWQYMEVYIISIVVSCAQIPVVCSLLEAATNCAAHQDLLDLVVEFNEVRGEGDLDVARCLGMKSTVLDGMWLMFWGSVFLYISQVVVREATEYVVNKHDALRVAQKKPYTKNQSEYYASRTKMLALFRCLTKVDDAAEGNDAQDPPKPAAEEEQKTEGTDETPKEQPAAEEDQKTEDDDETPVAEEHKNEDAEEQKAEDAEETPGKQPAEAQEEVTLSV